MIDSRAQLALVYLWSKGMSVRLDQPLKYGWVCWIRTPTDTELHFVGGSVDYAIELSARHFGWKG